MKINRKGNINVCLIIITVILIIGFLIYNGNISFSLGSGNGNEVKTVNQVGTRPTTEPDKNIVEINANSIVFYWNASDIEDAKNKIKANANSNTRIVKIKTDRSKVTVDMSNKIKKFAMEQYKADVIFIQE